MEEENRNEQKSYTSQDVNARARELQKEQNQKGTETGINVLKKIPYTAAAGEIVDKANQASGGRLAKLGGGIAGLTPEGRVVNRLGSNPLVHRAANAMNFNKGKGAEAAKNELSDSASKAGTVADKKNELDNNKSSAEKTKEDLEKAKSKSPDNSKTANKDKKNKDTNEENEEKSEQQSSRQVNEPDNEELEKEAKRKNNFGFFKDLALTLFGGTPAITIALTLFIPLLLFIVLFVSVYISVEEREQKLKAAGIGYAASATALTVAGDPNAAIDAWTVVNTIEAIKNGTLPDKLKSTITKIKNQLSDKFEDYTNLGNIFTSQATACSGDECNSRAEVQFYKKVSDIAYRYKEIYDVELDWPLIISTIVINSTDKEQTFKNNLGGYNSYEVKNKNLIIPIDWEYDYKNIANYSYLAGNDSRFDLAILAKNMVKKTTTQTCVDKDGNVIGNSKTLYNIETNLIDPELDNGYYLSCSKGEHVMNHSYTIDKEKYDDFLNEYFEMKLYINANGTYNSNSSNSGYGTISYGNDMASAMLSVATREIGNNEKDGSFHKYTGGENKGWCACFIDWVVRNTEYNGVKLSSIITSSNCAPKTFMDFFATSSADNINFYYNTRIEKYKNKGPDYTPKPGDIVFFSIKNCRWNAPSDPNNMISHVAIVTGFDGNKIYTIDGNSSDMVKRNEYSVNVCTDKNSVIGYGSWY